MDDSGGGWLTYQEAGDQLGISSEAVRAKASRKRWRRQLGNDGLARIWLPAGDRPMNAQARELGDRLVTPRSPPGRKASDAQLIKALDSHVETLKAQLAAMAARAERLESDFAARDSQHAAELAVERQKADRARAELSALADRLAQLVETNQRRPWWKRLAW